MSVGEALELLRRALDVEYRFIFYYPQVKRLMPDEHIAGMVETLGQDSVRHADTVARAISLLCGGAAHPTLDPLPDPLELPPFFRKQLEYERLALYLHTRAASLVPADMASSFHEIAQQERWHITLTERIILGLEQGPKGPG